jgi:hypothetical protein
METPAHQRRQIEDYLRSQSGDDFEIEHVEKLTSEYVLGVEYDVWDAHTSDGRWWVITNPVNLYSQDQIKSMDIALSFHIGLMSRMMASQPHPSARQGTWVLEVARRLDVASESLDRAREVEDFQAVGMRLRETLLTLAAKLASLGYQTDAGAADLQRGNFKSWAAVCAEAVAAGSSAQHLRALLKALSEKTWNYVAWLTHARSAGRSDAQIALSAASQTVEAFIVAVNRDRFGIPNRCPACASYRLRAEHDGDGSWIKVCETCGWETSAEPDPPVVDHDLAGEDSGAEEADRQSAPEGECVEPRDLGIYLSPDQARAVLEQASRQAASESIRPKAPNWLTPATRQPASTLLTRERSRCQARPVGRAASWRRSPAAQSASNSTSARTATDHGGSLWTTQSSTGTGSGTPAALPSASCSSPRRTARAGFACCPCSAAPTTRTAPPPLAGSTQPTSSPTTRIARAGQSSRTAHAMERPTWPGTRQEHHDPGTIRHVPGQVSCRSEPCRGHRRGPGQEAAAAPTAPCRCNRAGRRYMPILGRPALLRSRIWHGSGIHDPNSPVPGLWFQEPPRASCMRL